jgi:hypothetical protein
MNTDKLNKLIGEYETAIFATRPSNDKIDKLATAVELEADRVGYTNHSRLYHLHNMAESVQLKIEQKK